MKAIVATRLIDAPLEFVFETIADIRHYFKAVPDITKVEFLTDQQREAGTRFRETRLMRGREAQAELEIAEFAKNDYVRFVSDAGGTIWDSVFAV